MAASLGDLVLDLVGIPSVTGQEQAIADWLAARYRHEPVVRLANSLVVGDLAPDGRPLVVLAGHTDTVPPGDAERVPRRDGEHIVGRGTSDMKAGLAVAMAAFEQPRLRAGRYRLALVAYAGEEGPHEANELGPLLEGVQQLHDARLAVVLEPTDLTVQLGCLGVLHALVRFRGRAAHSARPWQGDNALTRAAPLLTALRDRNPVDVDVDGLVYREVLSATQAWTENARNVIPDAFTINLNYRFSPGTSLEDAEAKLRTAIRDVVGDAASVKVVDRAPAGPPQRDAPLVRAFLEQVQAPVQPKQAWTDVARFSAVGVPALNYGPGLTGQAHQSGEYVPEANLHVALRALERFLAA